MGFHGSDRIEDEFDGTVAGRVHFGAEIEVDAAVEVGCELVHGPVRAAFEVGSAGFVTFTRAFVTPQHVGCSGDGNAVDKAFGETRDEVFALERCDRSGEDGIVDAVQ